MKWHAFFFFHWFIDVTNWKTECKTEKHWEKVLQEENDIYNCICLDILKFIIGVGDGQGGLACCNSWGHKESDTTEWLNWTDSCLTMLWCFLIFSGEQRRDSAIHIHVSILPQTLPPPVYHITVSRVPCAVSVFGVRVHVVMKPCVKKCPDESNGRFQHGKWEERAFLEVHFFVCGRTPAGRAIQSRGWPSQR